MDAKNSMIGNHKKPARRPQMWRSRDGGAVRTRNTTNW